MQISKSLDLINNEFTSSTKASLLGELRSLPDESIEWLIMEHYQFSFANKGLLDKAVRSTSRLADQGVSQELIRNMDEEDGHAPMYKEGMRRIGTDMDKRVEYPPTREFLRELEVLASGDPAVALGALYATETAAIFEHETFFEVCREICERRGHQYAGSLIKHFHDIHLDGVEQGHKDGLEGFVNRAAATKVCESHAGSYSEDAVFVGGIRAIEVMKVWWQSLLSEIKIGQHQMCV